MKKPSVPSRSGISKRWLATVGMFPERGVGLEIFRDEVSARRQRAGHDVLVLRRVQRAGGVDDRAARADGARRRQEDLVLERGELVRRLGRRAPAQVGPSAQVPRPEHGGSTRTRSKPCPWASRASPSTTRTLRARIRAHVSRSARRGRRRARRRPPPLVAHQGGEVRRLRPVRRTGRARARPGRGRRPRHEHRGARLGRDTRPPRRRARRRVDRGPEDQRFGHALRGPAPSWAATSDGVATRALTRTAVSAGSLSAAMSERAASAPKASHHRRATHAGCEWRSAASSGVVSGSAATSAGASRAARRRTALTRPRAGPA